MRSVDERHEYKVMSKPLAGSLIRRAISNVVYILACPDNMYIYFA